MTETQQKFDSLIDQHAETLINQLTKTTIWDLKTMKLTASVYMKSVLSDCLNVKSDSVNLEYEKYKKILSKPGIDKGTRIMAERNLSKINIQRKKVNVILNNLQKEKEYQELKSFISNKFGNEVMQEFYRSIK